MKLRPSYNRLRHILVDRKMNMADLRRATGLGRNTTASLNADKSVSLDTLAVICEYLDCRIEDVVEFVPDMSSYARNKDGLIEIFPTEKGMQMIKRVKLKNQELNED